MIQYKWWSVSSLPWWMVSSLPQKTASSLDKQCPAQQTASFLDKWCPLPLEKQCPPSLFDEWHPPSHLSSTNSALPPLRNSVLPLLSTNGVLFWRMAASLNDEWLSPLLTNCSLPCWQQAPFLDNDILSPWLMNGSLKWCPPCLIDECRSPSLDKWHHPAMNGSLEWCAPLLDEHHPPLLNKQHPPLLDKWLPPLLDEWCPPSLGKWCPPLLDEWHPPCLINVSSLASRMASSHSLMKVVLIFLQQTASSLTWWMVSSLPSRMASSFTCQWMVSSFSLNLSDIHLRITIGYASTRPVLQEDKL